MDEIWVAEKNTCKNSAGHQFCGSPPIVVQYRAFFADVPYEDEERSRLYASALNPEQGTLPESEKVTKSS